MTRRPIDPPEIPAWRRNGASDSTDEDETPTLTSLPGADVFDNEETQWEAVPPSDSVAERWGMPSLPSEEPDDPRTTDRLTPQPLGEPPEDPRDLARRLAAEAKARLSTPPPAEAAEDPRELARRLAAEAKARSAPPAADPSESPRQLAQRLAAEAKAASAPPPPAAPAEDPRELARRLAAEAKARSVPPPAEPAESPRDLARRLAAEAKQRTPTAPPSSHQATEGAASAAPPSQTPTVRKEVAPTPPPKRALADRAGGSRPRTAKEILEAALRAETPAPSPPRAPTPAPEPTPAPPTATAPVAAPPVAPPPAQPAAPSPPPSQPTPAPEAPRAHTAPPAALILDLLPGAEVEEPMPVQRADVFKAVWRAHRTRAQHERDWATTAMASVLIDAADRVPPGSLVGARVTLHGTRCAVFADLERRALLAVLEPADVFLAGLGNG